MIGNRRKILIVLVDRTAGRAVARPDLALPEFENPKL